MMGLTLRSASSCIPSFTRAALTLEVTITRAVIPVTECLYDFFLFWNISLCDRMTLPQHCPWPSLHLKVNAFFIHQFIMIMVVLSRSMFTLTITKITRARSIFTHTGFRHTFYLSQDGPGLQDPCRAAV